MVHGDSQVKFKVSQTNIFQKAEKSRIVIISRAWIYTKIQALNFTHTKFYVKNE